MAARGDTKATVIGQDGLRFDLRVVPPEAYGSLLQHFTGSKDHNVALREAAQRQGLSVSEYGVTEVETGTVHAFATEEEVYGFLGYAWIPPELRENCGELEAARTGTLPELVSLDDLRGDLHTHTTWSDGKDTLEAMVAEAMHLGYSYYAICDHSHRLRGGRLAQQSEAIDRLATRVPIRLLKGIEVNIRVNGELDVADSELAGLDWVVASAHSSFDKDPTERVLAAMENPYVDCIGHLTGRKIGRRAPAAIDARARDREGDRDGHVPRDQLAAGPPRPHGRPRAGGARGGVEARDRLRRASDGGSPLRRARRRPGAPGMADEGGRREHAHVGAGRGTAEAGRDDLPRRVTASPDDLRARISPSSASDGSPPTSRRPASGPSSPPSPRARSRRGCRPRRPSGPSRSPTCSATSTS